MDYKFNILNILEHYKPDTNEVAKVLFPKVKYPRFALDRVLKGEAELSVSQLYKLADFLHVPATQLIDMSEWQSSCENGVITYTTNDGYKAVITQDSKLNVYKEHTLVYQGLIANKVISISELLTTLKSIRNGNIENGIDNQS